MQFQDITSQQLNYASAVLTEMESRLANIASVFDPAAFGSAPPAPPIAPEDERPPRDLRPQCLDAESRRAAEGRRRNRRNEVLDLTRENRLARHRPARRRR